MVQVLCSGIRIWADCRIISGSGASLTFGLSGIMAFATLVVVPIIESATS